MSKYVWLSFPMSLNTPLPSMVPRPELTELFSITQHGFALHILRAANHTGTHVDAPGHVIADGLPITAFTPDELIFTRPMVIDLHMGSRKVVMPEKLTPFARQLEETDLALFRFGYGPVRRENPTRFAGSSPGFGMEAARWLRWNCPALRAIGLDVPSLAAIPRLEETMPAHNILLEGEGRRFFILEDLDLEKDLTGLREVRVNPWMVEGMDSSPCTVVGVF